MKNHLRTRNSVKCVLTELGPQTYLPRKRAKNYGGRAYSELLDPSGRRRMAEILFRLILAPEPKPETYLTRKSRENCGDPHGMLKIVSNPKVDYFSQGRSVGDEHFLLRSSTKSRILEAETYTEHRREALLPARWVRRLKSLNLKV